MPCHKTWGPGHSHRFLARDVDATARPSANEDCGPRAGFARAHDTGSRWLRGVSFTIFLFSLPSYEFRGASLPCHGELNRMSGKVVPISTSSPTKYGSKDAGRLSLHRSCCCRRCSASCIAPPRGPVPKENCKTSAQWAIAWFAQAQSPASGPRAVNREWSELRSISGACCRLRAL